MSLEMIQRDLVNLEAIQGYTQAHASVWKLDGSADRRSSLIFSYELQRYIPSKPEAVDLRQEEPYGLRCFLKQGSGKWNVLDLVRSGDEIRSCFQHSIELSAKWVLDIQRLRRRRAVKSGTFRLHLLRIPSHNINFMVVSNSASVEAHYLLLDESWCIRRGSRWWDRGRAENFLRTRMEGDRIRRFGSDPS